ncbi:MAG: C69 family dipeptidase [Clostridia bacterium]|nr:C69 family dipeptidase [Clostridia bacterium]
MPCTTILAGKKATYDGSTMIARNEDYYYHVKKMAVILPEQQPRHYKTMTSHLEFDLPDDPMQYTACPNIIKEEGVWYGSGINACNVGMTATETITSNALVLGADPLVQLQKPEKEGDAEIPGGIGEEDFVCIVLPYVHTAREGVLRLGSLLEKYGTYEMNGIGFNDENEVWWLETIGGHHWMARKVKDENIVIMPNQLGIDYFDFNDAFGAQKEYLCSADLKEFVEKNHLDRSTDGRFSPRIVFGSRDDTDHAYNTPRSWFMGRYFLPTRYCWEGEHADFTPESDNIPWTFAPERKVTVEDIKYVLSSHMQGTPFDPYGKDEQRGKYRSIAVSTTGHTAILQIRGYMPEALKGIQWVCFGAAIYNNVIPVYTSAGRVPEYLNNVTSDVSTGNYYWSCRILAAMADPHFALCIEDIESFQKHTAAESHRLLNLYDEKMASAGDFTLCDEANEKICDMFRKKMTEVLNKVILTASKQMKDNFHRYG